VLGGVVLAGVVLGGASVPVDAGVLGVTVPAGLRVDGWLVGVLGAVVVPVVVDVVVAGTVCTQLTVTPTPLMSADLEAVTTVFCAPWAFGTVASKSVYSGNVKPGGTF
jgi:hypothetical protein